MIKMSGKRIISCPITRYKLIQTILDGLKDGHVYTIEELSELIGKNPSSINNALPIMKELGLVVYLNSKIELTPNGKRFVELLDDENKNQLKLFSLNILLPKSNILSEAYNILSHEPGTSTENLGILLNRKLDKDNPWSNPNTCKHVGRTCKSILGGLGLYEYKESERKSENRRNINSDEKLLPSASVKKIRELILEFDNYNKLDISGLKTKNFTYINNLIDLEIAKYIEHKNNILQLTDKGIKLKNATNESDWIQTFQDTLIENKIIVKIIDKVKDKKVDYWELGEIFDLENKVDWSSTTKRTYGVVLLNWLKGARIFISNDKRGKYHISPSFLEKYKTLFTSNIPNKDVKSMIVLDESSKSVDIINILKELHFYTNLILIPTNENHDENISKLKEIIDELVNNLQGEKKGYAKVAETMVDQYCEYNNKSFIEDFRTYISEKNALLST